MSTLFLIIINLHNSLMNMINYAMVRANVILRRFEYTQGKQVCFLQQ